MPIEGDPRTNYVDVTAPLDSHESALAAVRVWAVNNGRDPDEVIDVVVVKRGQLRSPDTHEFIGHRWIGAVPKRMVDAD